MACEPRQYIECTGVVDDVEALVTPGSPVQRGSKRQLDVDNKHNKKQFA